MKKIFALTLLLFSLFLFTPSLSFAQRGTITVSPQILQLDLSEDEPQATFIYKNNTNTPVELILSMEDVKELEGPGIPGFVDEKERDNYKYGLTSWATLSNQTLLLEPGDEKKVTVYIDKTRLTLGGHYASLLAEIQQANDKEQVKLRGIMSSFLFVRSGSEFETESGTITLLRSDGSFFSFPDSFLLRFQNTGNVDVKPYGILEITDTFGRKVAKGIVNNDSLISLPESIRQFDIPLTRLASFIPPGFYNAKVSVHFGKKNITRDDSYTFFSTGDINITLIAVVIFIALIILAFLKKRKKTPKSRE